METGHKRERWIFPKEAEGKYTTRQLEFFIIQADSYLDDLVASLKANRERHYSIINIQLVIIGALLTVLVASELDAATHLLLTALLVYFCIVCCISFLKLKSYLQMGPGFKPREAFGKGARDWTLYYHKDLSENSRLYAVLEAQQEAIDFNQEECDRQLDFLRHISLSIFMALAVAAVIIALSLIFYPG